MFFPGAIREFVVQALYLLPGIVLALSVHEFSHAYVSSRLGDPLPRASGRLSLNPIRHIDPLGLIMLFVARFGWAKPIMIDPRFYKHKKLGVALTALAGPAANLLTAFVLTIFFTVGRILYNNILNELVGWVDTLVLVILTMLYYGVVINVGLGLFNLIPVSPLDGSKVLASVLPLKYYNKVLKYEIYGVIILILLLLDIPARFLMAGGVPRKPLRISG